MRASSNGWHVYIVECADGTLYTGVTRDVRRRLAEHGDGGPRAAKYLKGRGPFTVRLSRLVGSRGLALRVEQKIKRLARWEKMVLLEDPLTFEVLVTEAMSG